MKGHSEFPVDKDSSTKIKQGEYLVVLENNHGDPPLFRIHLRVENTYTACNAHDFRKPCPEFRDAHIYKGNRFYKKLEPIMNLMGTRDTDHHLPCFIVTREELEQILGM